MADDRRLRILQAASRAFERRRFDDVVARLEELPDDGGKLGRGLMAAATALRLEEDGRTDEAVRQMGRVLTLATPLPEVQREAAMFFARQGQHARAHHAFLMADVLAPLRPRAPFGRIPESEWARYAPWAIRAALETPHGDSYAIGHMRGLLETELGPEGAALAAASMRRPGAEWPRDRTVERTLVDLIGYAREQGLDYEEVIPSTEVELVPPRVLGQPAGETASATTRTFFSGLLCDVTAVGKSNLLLAGDDVLIDIQGDELERFPLDLRVDALVASGPHGREVLTVEPRDPEAVRTVPEAVWLVGVHSNEFGHWMTEFLAKLLALMSRPGFEQVPILVDARMHHQHLEALRVLLGRPVHTIELEPGEHVRVGRLWVAGQPVYRPAWAPAYSSAPGTETAYVGEAIAELIARIRPNLEAIEPLEGYERLYLPRRAWQKRKLVNADEVEAELERAGFVRFDPWDASFRRQLQVIRSARYVVAPAGSAVIMSLFAPAGLRLGLFSHQNLESFEVFTGVYRGLGHELTVVAGEATNVHPGSPKYSDFRISPAAVRQLLLELEAVQDSD